MSLFALWLERDAVTREQAVEAISGNLCRCTGYRNIVDAVRLAERAMEESTDAPA
jgi:xanthine dehydrogenase iron-sulfur cluster and FAD-binding subunit A